MSQEEAPAEVKKDDCEPPEAEDAEYQAKASTRPKGHIFVEGEEHAAERFETELGKQRATRSMLKLAAEEETQRLLSGAYRSGPKSASTEGEEGFTPDTPIRKANIFSTPQIITFKIPKLPAMRDLFLVLDLGKLPTTLAVLPATFEADSDTIGPRASHLGDLDTASSSAAMRVYMSNQYHSKAADYRWQEEMTMLNPALVTASDKNSATADESAASGPVQSRLLSPKALAIHKSFALPFGKELGYTGDVSTNLCNTPVIALKEVSGNFYFALFSSVALVNVEIYCRVNQRTMRDEDDLCHPWRIARMFTVNPFSHDAFIEWFSRNKTALTLGATSLLEKSTGMNPLHVAMGYVADPRIVRVMIKHCGKFIKINATDSEGQSPLFKLLRRADVYTPASVLYFRALELIRIMAVEAGGYLDLQDEEGNTVMHFAARNHKMGSQIFAKLLEFGAQADMRNNAGRTPVEEAEHYGGVFDPASGRVIPRILPLDLREVRQLLAAALKSKKRQQEDEMEAISKKVAEEQQSASQLDSYYERSEAVATQGHKDDHAVPKSDATAVKTSQQPPSSGDLDDDGYPVSILLKMKREREANALRDHAAANPPPGPEDAQVSMGLMRIVPESEKRTIRPQFTMPKPLIAVGLGDEGAHRQFPTTVLRVSKRTGQPRLVPDGAVFEHGAGDSASSDEEEAADARTTRLTQMSGDVCILPSPARSTHAQQQMDDVKKQVWESLYEPPSVDTGAVFVPFSKRVPDSRSLASMQQSLAMAGSDLNHNVDSINQSAIVTSALDQEVSALSRRRQGEADLLPSYARKRQAKLATPKPFQSSLAPTDASRTYDGYVSLAAERASEGLSFRPPSGKLTKREGVAEGSGVLSLRLPPVEASQQNALLGTLMQKRVDNLKGRSLEECVASAETRQRNLANARNDGTISVPSYTAIRMFAQQKEHQRHLAPLRTGRGLPTDSHLSEDSKLIAMLEDRTTEEDLSQQAEEEAHKVINPDFITLGGFRGSYGLDAVQGARGKGTLRNRNVDSCNTSPARLDASFQKDRILGGAESVGLERPLDLKGAPNVAGLLERQQGRQASTFARSRARLDEAGLCKEDVANTSPDRAVSPSQAEQQQQQEQRLRQVRVAVGALNDATNIPTHTLLKLQEEYNRLEKVEGRGYLTVGQLVNVVKHFDSLGVQRSDTEIEELVRLGGLKRAHRHYLREKALGSNIVPPDGITFNDYCAIMLQFNRL